MTFQLTHQLIAEVALLGMALETIGGLYLAYDLLGGKQGPLRTVTRAGSFIALFLLGYTVVLGIRYALVAGIGMGALLAAEYRRIDKKPGADKARQPTVLIFGILRGLVLGFAAATVAGLVFGALFGILSAAGLTITYALGFTPTAEYEANNSPRISQRKLIASVLRAFSVAIAGLISAELLLHGRGAWTLGLRLGLAAGVVSALVGLFSPAVEWWVDNVPERRLGVVGLVLLLVGALLQSLQYWAVVFNLTVR
jgi:hypothetical protein